MKVSVAIFSLFVFCSACAEDGDDPMSQVTQKVGGSLEQKKGFLASFFSTKGDFALEEVMLITEENMNNRGALKVHMVIVFEKEVLQELAKMSAKQYFTAIDQLIKDYPDKIKVFEWELVAKKRIIPWTKIDSHSDTMTPLGGYIFADYQSSGEHRAKIPNYARVKIKFEKKDFTVTYEDQADD